MNVEFKTISSLEAMALIDQGNTNNLFFVNVYFVEQKRNGGISPNEWRFSSPLRYHEELAVYSRFKKMKVLAEPSGKHQWLLMEVIPMRPNI